MNSEPLQGCEVLPPMLTPEESARQAAQGKHKPRGIQPRGRRFYMLNTFVDCTLATLPRTDALVWLVLFRDIHGDTARSAQAYIARRAGVCVRTVKAAIKRLARAGLLDVVHRGGLNRGLSIYRLRPQGQSICTLTGASQSTLSVQTTCTLPTRVSSEADTPLQGRTARKKKEEGS